MQADFLIIGAGISGLTIAYELTQQFPNKKIIILEKEHEVGLHASGRNSGVLHSGIYYQEDSLKAKCCRDGGKAMAAFCEEHGLPISKTGKIILPRTANDEPIVSLLRDRAEKNRVQAEMIKAADVTRLEPALGELKYDALFVPEASVVNPKAILNRLVEILLDRKVVFKYGENCHAIDVKKQTVRFGDEFIGYDYLYNTAGLYADNIAKACGLNSRYTMIPFKGIYSELSESSSIKIRHLIYPVPDMNVPFLGVHVTKSITGKVYLGPTAIPALGREHYAGLKGIRPKEAFETLWCLGQQYLYNRQGFRQYAHQEIPRFLSKQFFESVRLLLPEIRQSDIKKSKKVGIRAQLLDKEKKELVMDFLVHSTAHETHVLNAVSPAFTSSLCFAKHVIGNSIEKSV